MKPALDLIEKQTHSHSYVPAFTLKQIVWAKVSSHPWWPARITKVLNQYNNSQCVYKVCFFGDPTYCFLEEEQLLDFSYGLLNLQQGKKTIQVLKKPIQLAEIAYNKPKNQDLKCLVLKGKLSGNEEQPKTSLGTMSQNTEELCQNSNQNSQIVQNLKSETANNYNFCQKTQMETENLHKPESQSYLSDNAITSQNTVQIITGIEYKQLKQLKGYNNRKQLFALQSKLKDALLSKYNLLNIRKPCSSVPLSMQHKFKSGTNTKRIYKKNQHLDRCRDTDRASISSCGSRINRRLRNLDEQSRVCQHTRKLYKIVKANIGKFLKNGKNNANLYALTTTIANFVGYLAQSSGRLHTEAVSSRLYMRIIRCIREIQSKAQEAQGESQGTVKYENEEIMGYISDRLEARRDYMNYRFNGEKDNMDGEQYKFEQYQQYKKQDEEKSKLTQTGL